MNYDYRVYVGAYLTVTGSYDDENIKHSCSLCKRASYDVPFCHACGSPITSETTTTQKPISNLRDLCIINDSFEDLFHEELLDVFLHENIKGQLVFMNNEEGLDIEGDAWPIKDDIRIPITEFKSYAAKLIAELDANKVPWKINYGVVTYLS